MSVVTRTLLLAALVACCGCSKRSSDRRSANVKEIRVLTDRTASHLQRLFDEYNRVHGVKIIANFVDKGLLARLQSRPTEADLVISKNAHVMELAKRRGLLSPFVSPAVEANVPAELRDPERYYTVVSYRARLIFYAKDRVRPSELSSYADLATPKWKGRICLRSGMHDYNLSLFSQLAVADGLEAAQRLLSGLDSNLARRPQGNDRAQVRAIMDRKCDLALANSYYLGIMLGRPDQRAWAEASAVFFPNQKRRGTVIMRSAAALTRSTQRVAEATALLDFLTGDYAQQYFARALLAYPVKRGVAIDPINKKLGAEQGLRDGEFKQDIVSLSKAADMRKPILEALDKLRFDRAR